MALKVNATSDSGWMTRGQQDDSPTYVKGRKVLKRAADNGKFGNKKNGKKTKPNGSRLKKKTKAESSEESEDEEGDSSEEEIIDLEEDSDQGGDNKEEESINSEDSDESEENGSENGDEDDEVIEVESSDEETKDAMLSRAAREKLTTCRKISEKLSAALSSFEAPMSAEEEGCLGIH